MYFCPKCVCSSAYKIERFIGEMKNTKDNERIKPMKNKKILLACNALDYILIAKILGGNLVLDRVDEPEEIISRRKSGEYDLLLIDIAFIRSDFKVLEGVAEEHLPVVVLSSEPYDARDEKLKQAGCCACYIKPIRQDLFAAFINYWIKEYAEQ